MPRDIGRRRERTLRDVAARAAADAIRTGRAGAARADDVGRAQDRPPDLKAEVPRVQTSSEGAEPNRYVVVLPAEGEPSPRCKT